MTPDMAAITTQMNVGGYTVDTTVVAYIKEASRQTGVSLEYMLAKAGQESSFSPKASSDKSSAVGIYQFTVSTWLQQFKLHGHKYGHKKLAEKIKRNSRGHYYVKDKLTRKTILNLRNDPRTSALLAAEYAKSNQTILEKEFKRKANPSDLYLAHFLGPVGAIKLLKAEKRNKWQSAVNLFPRAAIANPKIFYKKDKKTHRSVKDVHKMLNRLFARALRRFTNLPKDVFASLPRLLPTGKPSIKGPSLTPLVAPLNPKKIKLPDIDEQWAKIDLDEEYEPNEEDFDLDDEKLYATGLIANINQKSFNLDDESLFFEKSSPTPNFKTKNDNNNDYFKITNEIKKAPEPIIKEQKKQNVSVEEIIEEKTKLAKTLTKKEKKPIITKDEIKRVSSSIVKIIKNGKKVIEQASKQRKRHATNEIKQVDIKNQRKIRDIAFVDSVKIKKSTKFKAPENILKNMAEHVKKKDENKETYVNGKYIAEYEDLETSKYATTKKIKTLIVGFEETGYSNKEALNKKIEYNISDIMNQSHFETQNISTKTKSYNIKQVAFISSLETDIYKEFSNKKLASKKFENKIKQASLTKKETNQNSKNENIDILLPIKEEKVSLDNLYDVEEI